MGFLPWEIRVAFPGESQLWQSRATQPTVHAGCFSFSIIHQTPTWTTGSLTCAQMLMHVIAHGGVPTHVRESSWKSTLGEKSLATPGNRACISGMMVRCSNQLSYIPHPLAMSSVREYCGLGSVEECVQGSGILSHGNIYLCERSWVSEQLLLSKLSEYALCTSHGLYASEGSWDSLLVRVPGSWSKGYKFEFQQEQWESFLLQS